MNREKRKEKFTYVSLFSGIGGFEQGLNRLGGKCVMASEKDKFAEKSYRALYGYKTEGDITKIDEKRVPDHDILTAGFPCFPRGQRIVTSEGFKNIENIEAGDYVLTHRGRYRKVVTPMSKVYEGELYNVLLRYYRIPIKVTPEHPFYTERGWVEAKDLTEEDYVAFPLNKKRLLPKQIKYTRKLNGKSKKYMSTNLPLRDESFWKLIGYWLAKGWTEDFRIREGKVKSSYKILFSLPNNIRDQVKQIFNNLDLKYSISEDSKGKNNKIIITNQEYWLYVKQFTTGRKSTDKILPEFVQNLPIKLSKSLMEGYKLGDGLECNQYCQYVSTSLKLLEGVQRLLLKTDGRLYSLMKRSEEGKQNIKGKEYKRNKCYVLRGGKSQGRYVIFTDKYVYIKVDEICKKEVKNLEVFNMEVEEDNSYCLPMTAVHNCQSFSIAGERKGFEDTRGTLFFDIARIVKEKKPKVLLLENVKGLISHDGGKTLEIIIETLNNVGYRVDFKVLNSKYFGVPQNRERIYIIGVRDDLVSQIGWVIRGNVVESQIKRKLVWRNNLKTFNFNFPKELVVDKVLKDVLEEEVDEKYYINNDKVNELIKEVKNIGISRKNEENKKFRPKSLFHRNKERYLEYVGDKGDSGYEMSRRVYSTEGLSPTLTSEGGGNTEVKVIIDGINRSLRITGKGYLTDKYNFDQVSIRNNKREKEYLIRKITPLEALRLQAFPDDVYYRLRDIGMSDTQLYKQAGNAVTVTVIEEIGKKIIEQGFLD